MYDPAGVALVYPVRAPCPGRRPFYPSAVARPRGDVAVIVSHHPVRTDAPAGGATWHRGVMMLPGLVDEMDRGRGRATDQAPGHTIIERVLTMAAKRHRGVNEPGDVEAQRLNVRLDPAAYQRLMIHCVMSGQQPGRYIESLINTHCRLWKVQSNGRGPVATDDRPSEATDVNLAANPAA
jgi:hypothetical protein